MRTKNEISDFRERLSEKGIVMGLAPLREMCALLGDPQNKLPCVHIAGTNGKGSVLAMISAVLERSGLKTGRFFSPAVFSDEPTASINGKAADELLCLEVMDELINVWEEMDKNGSDTPTLFEMDMLCALICFVRSGCDIIVVECGMGGRDDATNIIDNNILCVITSVGYDHMSFLGDTLTEIAANKSGIFRPGCTVISAAGESCAQAEIKRQAELNNCRLITCENAGHIRQSGLDGQTFTYKGRDYRIRLCGEHQTANAAAAIDSLTELGKMGYPVTSETIREGLSTAVWHGRFECICRQPLFIIDGAHNVPAANALAAAIRSYLSGYRIILLIGMLADKEYDKVAEILAGCADTAVTFTPPVSRGLDGKILAQCLEKFIPVTNTPTVEEAVHTAVRMADEKCAVVAAGSLYSLDMIRSAPEAYNEA